MECCLKFNSLILVGAFCLFVTALRSDTRDRENEDPLSIPLINDKGTPLVAMLDTNTINRKIKVYIRTLMRDIIQISIREEIESIFRTSLEETSTIDFIRNITLQDCKPVYKDVVKLNTKLRKEIQWIIEGNKYTHILTSSWKYELRVDMIDANNRKIYAVYKTFVIGDAASKYKLTVGDYSGNAGVKDDCIHTLFSCQSRYQFLKCFVNSINIGTGFTVPFRLAVFTNHTFTSDQLKFHNGMQFTTIDQDNDTHKDVNCAGHFSGSWWYFSCDACDLSTDSKPHWSGTISKPVMMIRKV